MNIFILKEKAPDSSFHSLVQQTIDEFASTRSTYSAYQLEKEGIKNCTGCFGCWVKTPGECVIMDWGNEIAKGCIQSDLTIIITPVIFGSYSSTIKLAMDRLIPLISPFFQKYNGEVHHKPRYKKMPDFIFIGIQNSRNVDERNTFIKLVNRNAINLFQTQHRVLTFDPTYTTEEIIKALS